MSCLDAGGHVSEDVWHVKSHGSAVHDKLQQHFPVGSFGHEAQRVTHLWLQLFRASQQPRDAHGRDTADPHSR